MQLGQTGWGGTRRKSNEAEIATAGHGFAPRIQAPSPWG